MAVTNFLFVSHGLVIPRHEEKAIIFKILENVKRWEGRSLAFPAFRGRYESAKSTNGPPVLKISSNKRRGQVMETVIKKNDVTARVGRGIGGFGETGNISRSDDGVISPDIGVGAESTQATDFGHFH
jgi:hypothetical protein